MPSAPNPDPRTHGTVTRGDDGQITIVEPKVPKTPEEKDEMFTSIATLLVAGYTGYLAYGGGFQLETWTFWLITLTPASIVLGGLLKYPLLARKLRLITNALIGLGVLYLLIRFLAA